MEKLFKKTGINAMLLKAESEAKEKRNGLHKNADGTTCDLVGI